MGFIVKDNKKYYYPIIEKVKDLIEDQKEKILNAEKVYSEILKGFIKSNTTKAFLLYGKEGIKQMFLNELNSKTDIYVICTDIERTENLLGDLFLKKFTYERIKRGIKINMLTSKKSKPILKKYDLLEVRILPFEFITPASFSSYNNIT